MKVLDLFCGIGGASMGIAQAGHVVYGIDNDIRVYHDYPFKMLLYDIQRVPLDYLETFDAFWASPPCQHYSKSTIPWKMKGYEYDDLISYTRDLLEQFNKPYVIENVVSSPLQRDLMLCMSMFDDGREYMVRKHRVFEIHGFTVPQPKHITHTGVIGDGRLISTVGNGGGKAKYKSTSSIDAWQIALGINWTRSRRGLAQAIPPTYSHYIFKELPV